MRILALIALLAATASAQPVLAPDSVESMATRAARNGLISDSTAAYLAVCAGAGVPVTRSAIVDAVVRRYAGDWSFAELQSAPDSSDLEPRPLAFMATWVDRLAEVGLLTADDVDAMASVLAEVEEATPTSASRRSLLRLVGALLAKRTTLDPAWLAEDAEAWVERGLLTDAGRARLLADAQAGRFWVAAGVLPYLDVTERTGVDYAQSDAADLPPDVLVDAGIRLLRRRGVADLRVEALAVDSVRRVAYNPFGSGWDETLARPTAVLTAQVDGVIYRQQIGYRGGPLTLLNRVLRDRRVPYRLGTAGLPNLDRQRTEVVVVVASPADRALLQPGQFRDLSPPRRRVIEAAGRNGDDASCRDLAFDTFTVAWLETEISGPSATGREGALTRNGLTRTLDRLQAVGLMDSLAPEVRAPVRAGLHEQYLTRPQEILEAIPELVVALVNDDGTYGVDQPYASEIRRFAEASRGAFRPTDIVDMFSFEADSARVGFTASGRAFETTVKTGSWLYSSFVDLIAEAVDGSGIRLYRLGLTAEDGYAFLSHEQWAELATLGLLGDGAGPVAEVGSTGW